MWKCPWVASNAHILTPLFCPHYFTQIVNDSVAMIMSFKWQNKFLFASLSQRDLSLEKFMFFIQKS